jgi:hypothetical protein
MKKKIETKGGQAYVTLQKWKFENELHFLQPYLKDRTTITSIYCAQGQIYGHSSSEMEGIQEDNPTVPISLSHPSGTPISDTTKSSASVVRLHTRPKSLQFPKKTEPQKTSSAVIMKYLLNQTQADDIGTFF